MYVGTLVGLLRSSGPSLPDHTHHTIDTTGVRSATTTTTTPTGCRQPKLDPDSLRRIPAPASAAAVIAAPCARTSGNPSQSGWTTLLVAGAYVCMASRPVVIRATAITDQARSTRNRVSSRSRAASAASTTPAVIHAGAPAPGLASTMSQRLSGSASVGTGSPASNSQDCRPPNLHEAQDQGSNSTSDATSGTTTSAAARRRHETRVTVATPTASTHATGTKATRSASQSEVRHAARIRRSGEGAPPRKTPECASHGRTRIPTTVPSRPCCTAPVTTGSTPYAAAPHRLAGTELVTRIRKR